MKTAIRVTAVLLLGMVAVLATAAPSYTVLTEDFSGPWSIEFIDSDTAIVTEKRGQLWLYELPSSRKTMISGVPEVHDSGQGGLLDVALDPEFNKNQQLYFCYSHRSSKGNTTRLAKARLMNDRLNNLQVLFTAEPYFSATRHYGCRIAFDQAGFLYLTVGDRGERDLAQSLGTHNGKVIRLARDGSVPEDNPFVGQANARPEIYSYGHRNPQGLVYDSLRNRLIEIEHGPRGGDEINVIEAGKNFGWPVITYGREYSGFKVGDGETQMEGMEQPLYYYVPSIAPGGADFYTGEAFPEYKGDLFIGALKLQHLNHIQLNEAGGSPKETRWFESMNQRIRDVKQSPDKQLYFITDGGWLVRVDKL